MIIHILRRKRIGPKTIHEETVTKIEGLPVSSLSLYGRAIHVDGSRYEFNRFNDKGEAVFTSFDIIDDFDLVCECGHIKDGGTIGNSCYPSNCPQNY